MIVKSRNVRVSQVSAGKAASALSSHSKYIEYRERNVLLESKEDRHLFNKESDHVNRKDAQHGMMEEPAGDIYYHRIILSPSSAEHVEDLRAWTRDIMRDLEHYYGMNMEWYAAQHRNTDDPHVHVVLQGTGENKETGQDEPIIFTRDDFRFLRERGRAHSDYEHTHLIETTWNEMDERDTITQDIQRDEHHEPERTPSTASLDR
jgi:type IV secretory pathway VirD2 relaxase